MSKLMPFQFKDLFVRVITLNDGDVLFIAKDVAVALGYEKPSNAISQHCKKSKSLKELGYPVLSPQQLIDVFGTSSITVIPESDVYRLVMRSQLESAEKFQDWVVEEVLPSIRKTGKYELKPADQQYKLPGNYIEALEALLESEKQRALDAPKVRLATLISESSNARCIRVWVKTMKNDNNLCVGERDVFRYLIDKKYIFKPRGEKGYLPYSRHESTGTGFFTVIVDEINGKPRRMLKITGKGVLNLTAKVIEHFNGSLAMCPENPPTSTFSHNDNRL